MKSSRKKKAEPLSQRLKTDFQKNWLLYVMLLPVLIYLIIFCYAPMYGVIIAFKNFKPRLGILGSDWVGLKYFKEFVGSVFFGRTLKNTLMISGLNLLFGFSAPIIFAILLNEVVNMRFKKVVQTITYLPHFITTVVIASLILVFTNSDGFITQIVNSLTGHQGSLIADPHCFRAIYIISDIWQSFGWGSIVYLAAITGIDPQLYEAAIIDGANKLQRIWNIDIPTIMPTMVILLVMNFGSIMNVGYEKVFLMQNDLNMSASEIISTYTYKIGLQGAQYSYSTAIGLFNNIINFVMLVVVNRVARGLSGSSLW